MKLDEFRGPSDSRAPSRVDEDTPVLVGCGIIPDELPPTDGLATIGFAAPSMADLQRIRHTESLAERVWPLIGKKSDTDTITLGRRPKNDVVIPDFPISAFHCFFQKYPEGMAIIDSGSTNGTCINGVRLVTGQPAWVRTRDIVTMGRFAFRYFATLGAALDDDDPVGGFMTLTDLAA